MQQEIRLQERGSAASNKLGVQFMPKETKKKNAYFENNFEDEEYNKENPSPFKADKDDTPVQDRRLREQARQVRQPFEDDGKERDRTPDMMNEPSVRSAGDHMI